MSLQLKGLHRSALLGTSLVTLAACDCGYNAGYLAGAAKSEEQTIAAVEPAPTAVLFAPAETRTRKSSSGDLTRMRDKQPASINRIRLSPEPEAASSGAASAQVSRTPGASYGNSDPESGASAATRTIVVAQPFAPLRPGSGGGGAIIRVGGGNNPGGGSPGANPGGGANPGNSPGGILDPIVNPIVTPVLGGAADIARITVIDTKLLGGASNNSQLIGAGVGSATPIPGQLASVSVLPQNGSSAAAVNVVRGDVASIAVLPGAQGAAGRPADSLAAIAVGNTPVLAGGQSPLVTVSALPNLPVAGGILSPVAGTPGTPSTPAVPALSVIGVGAEAGLAGGLGATVGNLAAGLGLGTGLGVGASTAPAN